MLLRQKICRYMSSKSNEQLFRSLLLISGSNENALSIAVKSKADALCFDLEELVPAANKEKSRELVLKHLSELRCNYKTITVRINSLETEWGENDLKAICQSQVDAIIIPKVKSSYCIKEVSKKMSSYSSNSSMVLWAMIETPLAVLQLSEIACSDQRLQCLIADTSNLSKNLGCSLKLDRMPLHTSLSLILLAARAYQLKVIDGPYINTSNMNGFLNECKEGLNFGFDGKLILDSEDANIVNKVFSPSKEDIDYAKRVIQEYSDALTHGKGVAVLDGKLIENLHVSQAQDILKKHQKILQSIE